MAMFIVEIELHMGFRFSERIFGGNLVLAVITSLNISNL